MRARAAVLVGCVTAFAGPALAAVPLRRWINDELDKSAAEGFFDQLFDLWPRLLCGLLVLLVVGAGAWRWGTRRSAAPVAELPADDPPGCEAERAAVREAEARYEAARIITNAAEGRVTEAEEAIGAARERLADAERAYAPSQTARDRAELRRDVPGIVLPDAGDPAQTAWEELYLLVLRAEEELRVRIVERADAQRRRTEREAVLAKSSVALAGCRPAPPASVRGKCG